MKQKGLHAERKWKDRRWRFWKSYLSLSLFRQHWKMKFTVPPLPHVSFAIPFPISLLRACLVARENAKELESIESIGYCVIYKYLGAHKFSLSISHFFWAHTLYFSSLLNLPLLSIFTPFTFHFFTFLPTTKQTLGEIRVKMNLSIWIRGETREE